MGRVGARGMLTNVSLRLAAISVQFVRQRLALEARSRQGIVAS